MGAVASQITSLVIVYSIGYSDADQSIHQSSASLAFVRGIIGELTGEFLTQMASNAENVSIWWRHHAKKMLATDSWETLYLYCLLALHQYANTFKES